MNKEEYKEQLLRNIKILNETIWDGTIRSKKINNWLSNFEDSDHLNALFLLSKFMFFGKYQIREILVAWYRDLYKYPIVEEIRKKNHDTTDMNFLNEEFDKYRSRSKIVALGNISESSTHLLYFLRQENKLPKSLFPDSHDLFTINEMGDIILRYPDIDRYVFFDDFCGSGNQAVSYSKDIVRRLKDINGRIQCICLMLFSTEEGKQNIKENSLFDEVDSVVTIDDTFKVFSENSRILMDANDLIDREELLEFCEKYGSHVMSKICSYSPDVQSCLDYVKLGYSNSQLLIGFEHNVPDNTLPIIWYNEDEPQWTPIFKRYNKIYG